MSYWATIQERDKYLPKVTVILFNDIIAVIIEAFGWLYIHKEVRDGIQIICILNMDMNMNMNIRMS